MPDATAPFNRQRSLLSNASSFNGLRIAAIALGLVLLWLVAPSAASELRLDAAIGSAGAEPASEVFRDPTGRLTLGDILGRRSAFVPAASLVPDLRAWAFAPSTLWFKLRPRAAEPGPWYLHTTYFVDRAEMYFVAADGHVERTPFGMLIPFAQRQLPTYSNTIVLPEKATREGTLYLRIVTDQDAFGGFTIRPAVWEAVIGRSIGEERLLPQLVIIGIVGALALFNLVLGLMLKERIYFWYAAATGSFALNEIVFCGAAWRWLWPNASLSFTLAAYVSFLLYFACVLWFARAYLDLSTTQRTLWRALVSVYALGALAEIACALVPNIVDDAGVSPFVDIGFSGSLLLGIFWGGVVAARRGYLGGRSYCIAFAGVVIGLLVGSLGSTKWFPEDSLTDAAPGIGVAWEAIVFALALADRISRLRSERDQFEAEALVDGLTGIANRRAFDKRVEEEWRRGTRGGTQLATVLIDVDFFKSYDDQYGHLAGDRALKLVAVAIARSVCRPDDYVARYGGEEFIVLLPYCSATDAVRVADVIRAAVQSLDIRHDVSASGRLTVSAGASSVVPSEAAAPEQMIAAADRALYLAKRGGRNRVAECETLVA